MLATKRGVALVRRASPYAANDNVPGSVAPDDDIPFFLALGAVCLGVVALAIYVLMYGRGDVGAMLRR